MIQCYMMDVETLMDDALFLRAMGLMSDPRREKVSRFRFRKDQNLSLGAGLLLEYALRSFGLHERQMSYATVRNGKPCFANSPQIHFNLSHSGKKVLLAISDREVGCDIEEQKDMDLSIAEQFFVRSEYEHIRRQDSREAKTDLFFRYWTLKESFMKYTGYGLACSPADFELVPGKDKVEIRQSLFTEKVFFSDQKTNDSYHLALCSPIKMEKLSVRMITAESVLERGADNA